MGKGDTIDRVVDVYVRWSKGPEIVDIFKPFQDGECESEEGCIALSRVVVLVFYGYFMVLPVFSAISDRVPTYKRHFPFHKRLAWVSACASATASIYATVKSVLALRDPVFSTETHNPTLLQGRSREMDFLLAYTIGYACFDFIIAAMNNKIGGVTVDVANLSFKLLLVVLSFSCLVEGMGSFIPGSLLVLEFANPLLKITWMVEVMERKPESLAAGVCDILSTVLLAVRLVWVVWIINVVGTAVMRESALLPDNFKLAIGLGAGIAALMIHIWIIHFRVVLNRLGGNPVAYNRNPWKMPEPVKAKEE